MRLGTALAALMCLFVAASVATADDSKLDKKAVDIVKQVGDLYKNAKSLHADITLQLNTESNGEKQKVQTDVICDLQQPNRFALRSHPKGDKDAGISIVSDGKRVYVCAPKLKQYTDEPSPDTLKKMGALLVRRGPNAGILFANVLSENPHEQLMEGVNSCSYAGKEKVGDVEAHHLKFSQDDFDWELWVAAEGKPFVLKMSSGRSGDEGKFSLVETYRNWKLDQEPAKDAFAFSPPKDAKKVDKLDGDEEPRN